MIPRLWIECFYNLACLAAYGAVTWWCGVQMAAIIKGLLEDRRAKRNRTTR